MPDPYTSTLVKMIADALLHQEKWDNDDRERSLRLREIMPDTTDPYHTLLVWHLPKYDHIRCYLYLHSDGSVELEANWITRGSGGVVVDGGVVGSVDLCDHDFDLQLVKLLSRVGIELPADWFRQHEHYRISVQSLPTE